MASVLPLVSWLVPLLSCTIAVQASCEGDSCAHAAQSPSLLSVKSELHSVLASATATLPGLDLSDGNGSTLNDSVETMIRANLAHDFEEHHNIPDPATNQTEGDSGMGSLGRNIEFMFLKVAELETIVELQQAQIMSLTDRLNAVENKTGLVQKEVPKESIHHPQHPEKVQNIFKKVWKKHHYQREKKRFVTPDHPAHPSQKAKAEAAKAEAKKNEALLQRHQQENHQEDEDDEVEFQEDSDQDVSDDFDGDTSQSLIDSETNSLSNSTGWRRRRRRWIRRRIFSSVVNTVSNAASSAVNSVTNTMADAYSQAADKVAFVANTAIDSVEMAVDILTQGFSDWSADCPEATKPSLNVDSNGVSVNWGRQKCRISLMGQRVTIFDFNFGSTNVNWPEPLKTVAKPGFPEWSAGCPEFARPSLSVSSNGLDLDFGRQKCEISMMGKTLKLIDFDFGRTSLQWPEPLKTVTEFGLAPIKTMVDLGRQAVNCATGGGPLEVFKCFGLLIIEQVPPLSFLTRMGDMIQEFIEVFAVVAKTIVKKVIEEKASLLSEAATSKFPRIGESPAIHHASKNLAIKKHTRRGPGAKKLAKMKRASKTSLLQEGDDDGGDSDSLFEFEIHDNDGNYATKLITQFAGKEIDTASCLAFAPKTRSGSNGAVAQSDWQVNDEDDFIKLEPWAVPCDNSWMMDKDHLTKWAGYSFYTWEMAIEKCVTVSYALSMQPVLAFVGGLEFDILPAPLADIDTMVCWPDKQPGGVDLSVLRTVISSGGVMLYSRTLRLVKRFGDNTDFTDNNIYSAYETYRNPAGVAVGSHSVEDDRTLEAMDRTASLLQNRSQTPEQPELVWRDQELYLATMEYGKHLEQTILSEHRNHAAAHRLGLLQTDATSSAKSGADELQLFRFRNPGLVSFEIKGEMVGNQLDMVMQVSFGGFNSPEKRIKLVDLVDQFAVVLTAMPFVSVGTKAKAIAALKGFNEDDVKKVVPKAWDLASTEYEADWGYSFDHEGWSFSPPNTAITGFRRSHENNLYNLEAAKYRSTQFDEEECEYVNLSPALDNANSWGLCPDGYFFHGLNRGPWECKHIGCIEWGKCCRPKGAGRWGQCQIADWSTSFDDTGSSTCPFPYGLVGLYRSGTSGIQGIELAYCCELGVPTNTETNYYLSATEYAADWSSSFDSAGWSSADGFITGFHRSSGTELYYLETAFYRKPHEGWTCKHGDWSASLDHAGWSLCPEGYYIKALERSNNYNLHNVEKADCCKPNSAPEKWGPCYEEDWSYSFDQQHSDSKCKLPNTALVGLERDETDNLSGIKKGKCCQLPPATMGTQDFSVR